MDTQDTIIIGSGCAGLTAGIYSSRANLKTIIFAGNLDYKGGLLMKTSIVENYPGYPDGILGSDLILNFEKQAIKYGCDIIDKDVISIKKYQNNYWEVQDSNNNIYITKTIIIATGSTPNKLGLEDEDSFWSNGISSCAVCDGFLYKNKKIVVVGEATVH